MKKHPDSIRTYRLTWRTRVNGEWLSHHAYTDERESLTDLSVGIATFATDVTSYAWNGKGYEELRA